jgi:selenocysteine lyase/cysteine desulfurase
MVPVEEFPILEHGLYANHAAVGPWPKVATQAVVEFAQENSQLGPEKYARWLLREKRLRKGLAALLNAESVDDIALLKNTTEGICTVANGIDWNKGDNIVLPLGEFPSNRLPWLALQRFGVEVREVDIRSTDNPESALLTRMDERTRLLSVSAVQWTDGLRLRLETLGQACRQNRVLLFVDAIQQMGAMQMDVQACGIDFLAADGHKWLLAPEGVAVFYCSEKAREQLQLRQHGWHMVDGAYDFNRDEWQASRSAVRFEAGSPNMLGQAALHASVALLHDVGMSHVEACVSDNSRALSEGLAKITGLELLRPFDPQRVSGIVSFKPLKLSPASAYRALKRRQLTASVRGDAIRLSPHFYQVGKPIEEMLAVIEDSLRV